MITVVLVGPEVEENLSLRYIAASLDRAGFSIEILPFNSGHQLGLVLDAIQKIDPILVGISLAFQWRAMDALALAVALREQGYKGHITTGGHFGTFENEAILRDFPEVDSVCLYEAEETIVALTRALEEKKELEIEGLSTREGSRFRATKTELSELPWPDRRGDPPICLGHRIAPLVASRGCYANCSFCCIAAWHTLSRPQKRFRLRPVEDVAEEMLNLAREHGTEIFIFHDDNFFLPSHERTLDRINALADALDGRLQRFGTVVKARPTDVTEKIFSAMKERLGCIRVFLGVENDAPCGLETLHRRVTQEQNHEAMEILRALGIYVCFNMLIFDPDTTLQSLRTNLDFMSRFADTPHNFGRVELYAGTPLLSRMQEEGRCSGDYIGWNYTMATPEVERVFQLAMRCFYDRNFAAHSLANRLMGTRFDVEVCEHFHPEKFDPAWREEALSLNRALTQSSVEGLEELISSVEQEDASVEELSVRLRQTEQVLRERANLLEKTIQAAVDARCQHVRVPAF